VIPSGYEIRRAGPEDVALLPDVELSAARLFETHLGETGLTDEHLTHVTSVEHFEKARQAGHLWVAVGPNDEVAGFALAREVGGCAHLDELDVLPAHGKRGVGSALLAAVCSWAREAGHPAVTLRTFRDVPWNRPFYEHRGFCVVESVTLSEAHVALEASERRRGLRTDLRVAMTCEMAGGRPKDNAMIARAAIRAETQENPLMPKLIVLYPPPADATLFEHRYRVEHAPMVLEKIPGLKKFVASQVIGAPAGTAAYHRVAELYFDSLESLQAAMASAGGQSTVAHAMEISTGGPPVVLIAEDDQPL
jgi:uncharacterized protein (TIGR02118 family)